MVSFATDEWLFFGFGMLILVGAIIKITDSILGYKIEKLRMVEKSSKLKDHKPKLPQTTIDKLKEFEEVDKFLLSKLETLYNSFIYKKLLYTLKMYSSLAEATKKEFRNEFIEYVDFNTTTAEREIYKNRWSFQQFKFIIVNYFNIKTTKLELMVIQKIDISKVEFKDQKLIESLFNDLTSKDINEIFNSIIDIEPKNDKAGGK